MQHVYITEKKLAELKANKEIVPQVEKACRCKILIDEGMLQINGSDAVLEFTAKNILFAFGRGFEIEAAMRLTDPDYYFKLIDLKQISASKKRVMQIKARIIGINGRAKKYIEEVSGALISIHGDTVGMIGDVEQVAEAECAINTLIDGGTHKLAYLRMETMHRNNKAAITSAKF